MMEKNKSFIIIALVFIFAFTIRSSLTSELDGDAKTNLTIPKHRIRRHLVFQNGSRILFRTTVRDNIIKINQIFGHAFGFRANIDIIQPPLPHHHTVIRREIYQTVEQLITQHGFDGRACIFKMICDAAGDSVEENGMFLKLFKLIFTHKSLTEYGGVSIPFLLTNGCKYLQEYCPLTTFKLSPYTDI